MTGGTPVDLDRLRSIGFLGGGRTRDTVREWRDDAGRHKATRDELGHVVTQHAVAGHTEDRQDVQINASTIALRVAANGES
jgi:hypothetical protein